MAGREYHSKVTFWPSLIHMGKPVFTPVLAPLIRKRWHALVMVGAAAVIFSTSLLGVRIWFCPFKYALGISCPGCGLGTAIALLIHGDWQAALATHAFAPVFLLGLIFIGASVVMPGGIRQKFLHYTAKWESRLGIVPFILVCLLAYWLVRF